MRRIDQPSSEISHKTVFALVLFALVIPGGMASFLLNSHSVVEEVRKEEFQFVDCTPAFKSEPDQADDPLSDIPPKPIDDPKKPPFDAEIIPPFDDPANPLVIDPGVLITIPGDDDKNFVITDRPGGGEGSIDGATDPQVGSQEAEAPHPNLKTQAIYPSALLKKGIGGKVIIMAVVSTAGQVIHAKVKNSSGHEELDRAAMEAVIKWKFKPGKKNGKDIQATCTVPYTFELKRN